MRAILEQIVARCHVSRSNRDVVRYAISRLRKGYPTFRAMPRRQRRAFLRHCVELHQENRGLYLLIQTGRL
jgi:acyl-CoA reductase-like NAD-dependent aldehyde dehydrogenase